jgi:hypothetical protein
MTNLYIIGNGFDLDLGLKTSYADFIESDEFKELIKPSTDCSFAKYLNEKYRENYKWMDVENELKIYINNIYNKNGTAFKQEFNLIKKSLREYLNKVTLNEKINYNSNAARICNKILTDLKNNIEVRVVNFNYTNTLLSIVKKINSDNVSVKVETEKIIYLNPHGEIQNGIVFGIEDGALLDNKKDFLYLTKGADPNHVYSDWHESYFKSNEITVFGHSLGDSDFDSFAPLFSYLVSSRDSKKKLNLYFLEEDSDFYNMRLDKYTQGGLTALSINHIVKRNPEF